MKTIEPQKLVQNKKKKQNRRPEPRKHSKAILVPFTKILFRDFETFLEVFGLHHRALPSFVSIFCNKMDAKKTPKGTPFTFFGTAKLFDNLEQFDVFFKLY